MTAPAPLYRFIYSILLRHGVIRGNMTARTVKDVRDSLVVIHGPELAEAAHIGIASVEETTSE